MSELQIGGWTRAEMEGFDKPEFEIPSRPARSLDLSGTGKASNKIPKSRI